MIVRSKFNSSFPLMFHEREKRKKRDSTDRWFNQVSCVTFVLGIIFVFFSFYFMLIRVLKERTTLRIAVCGGLRRTRLGQLVFCLLERRRAKPERSPSSSSDVQGTTPREDVACINSWSGPFRCSYNKMFNVSSYIRASGNSTWKYLVCYTILISTIEHLYHHMHRLMLPLYASYLSYRRSNGSKLRLLYDRVRKMSNSKSHSSRWHLWWITLYHWILVTFCRIILCSLADCHLMYWKD